MLSIVALKPFSTSIRSLGVAGCSPQTVWHRYMYIKYDSLTH